MRAVQTLRDSIEPAIASIHTRRATAVFDSATALLICERAVPADLGRAMAGSTSAKHGIKRFDRLLGNEHLHRELLTFRTALASLLLNWTGRLLILVDWSEVPAGGERFCELRASVVFGRRALPLYSEVHPIELEGNRIVHGDFLRKLRRLIGDRQAILITDAGFQRTWFVQALEHGFDFIGRIRRGALKCSVDGRRWLSTKTLGNKANVRPRSLGRWLISRANPFPVYITVRKEPGRAQRTGSSRARKARQRHHGPWILASSLSLPAKRVSKIYSLRMGIEGGFRDDKSARYGWSFEHCGCRSAERLEVMLLLIAIATIVAALVGQAAFDRGDHLHYQANTIRDRLVLSLVRLGRCVLQREPTANFRPGMRLQEAA